MLILTRRIDESIKIGDDVTATVLDIRKHQVRFGVKAPQDVPVHRDDDYQAVGESIRIGDSVTVTAVAFQGNQVRIGISAPRDVAVHREEIYKRLSKPNAATRSFAS